MVKNTSTNKVAVKVKTNQVNNFRISPVFSFIEPQAQGKLTIVCKPFEYKADGAYSTHRIIILFGHVDHAFTGKPKEWWGQAKTWRDLKVQVRYDNAPKAAEPAPGEAAAPGAKAAEPAATKSATKPVDAEGAPAPKSDHALPGAPKSSQALGGTSKSSHSSPAAPKSDHGLPAAPAKSDRSQPAAANGHEAVTAVEHHSDKHEPENPAAT